MTHNKLEFLGLKNNPFYSKELKGDWLELFTNREKEIERALFYIESGRTIAICSKQGIGKSSFLSFLNERILPKENILSRKFNFAPTVHLFIFIFINISFFFRKFNTNQAANY